MGCGGTGCGAAIGGLTIGCGAAIGGLATGCGPGCCGGCILGKPPGGGRPMPGRAAAGGPRPGKDPGLIVYFSV